MRKRFFIVSLIGISFIALYGAIFSLPKLNQDPKIWKGFYLVGIPENEVSKVENILLKNYKLISKNNTKVIYNDFTDIKSISLANLKERFVKGDFRIDPFMKGSSEFFLTESDSGKKYNIFYLKNNKGEIGFYLGLRKLFGKEISKWLIPDVSFMDNIISILIFILCWVFEIWMEKKSRLLTLCLGIPWFISIGLIGFKILPVSIALYLFIVFSFGNFADDLRFFLNYKIFNNKKIKVSILSLLLMFLILSIYLIFNSSILAVLISFFVNFLCLAGYYLFIKVAVNQQEHKTFFPVSLNINKRKHKKFKIKKEALLIILVLLATFLLPKLPNSNYPVRFPIPIEYSTVKSWNWEDIKNLHQEKTAVSMVDVSDYLCHIAYQENYMYCHDWKFPQKDEVVLQNYYEKTENSIKYSKNYIFKFTENWYSNIINKKEKQGLDLLLLSQEKPSGVKKEILQKYKFEYSDIIQYVICFIIIALLLNFSISQNKGLFQLPTNKRNSFIDNFLNGGILIGMKLLQKTFPRGGVHPKGQKTLTNKVPIKRADIPEVLTVPLSQHLGAPAEIVVEQGAEVEEGAVIGKAAGFISAAIHSPISGKVKDIKEIYLANGLKSKAAIIEKADDYEPKEYTAKEWENKSSGELVEIIKNSGIVGMGGATFPANVKYSIPKGERAEYLIINGVECEPYLSADHRLMIEKTKDIIEGLRILKKAINPEKIAIGIEVNKPDAIDAIKKQAENENFPLEVVPLKLKYPQGDEKQLIKAVTGREVPSGGLPIAVGCVVSNVGTVNAVYEAVALEKPLIERVVCVSGLGIKNPGNYLVRIGTPISRLIEMSGGFKEIPEKIVVGGPMMGFTIYDVETPVTKGTSGILALTAKEVGSARRTSCLSCGICISVCPMGLNPTKMFKSIDHSDYSGAIETGLMDCKECGCCAYSCPAHIPLVNGMKLGKKMARKKVS